MTPQNEHGHEQLQENDAQEMPNPKCSRRNSAQTDDKMALTDNSKLNNNDNTFCAQPIKKEDPTPQNIMEVGQPDPHPDNHLEAIRDIPIFHYPNGYKGKLYNSRQLDKEAA